MGESTFEFCTLAAILSLGELGFGKTRLDRFLNIYKDLCSDFVDRYEDCVIFSLRKKCKELYGIDIEIKTDVNKGE